MPAIFFSFPFIGLAANQPEPEISGVSLTLNHDSLFLSFRLSNGMPVRMEELIKSGVPVRYIFQITLKKKGFLWDDELKSIEIRRTISFDNLKNKYFLYFDYPATRLVSVDSLKSAKRFLFSVERIRLVSMARLEKGKKYTIEIRAKAEKVKSSMPFSRLVKLFSSFGFSSKTYEFEFTF